MRFDGRDFEFILGSDVRNDGMYLELNEVVDGRWEAVADVFYSDADGSMSLTQYAERVPGAALAWLEAEAQRRLPPAPDAV